MKWMNRDRDVAPGGLECGTVPHASSPITTITIVSEAIRSLNLARKTTQHQTPFKMATGSTNRGNVYSSLSLSEYMRSSLPKDASPHLRNPYDAVALLSHACMLAVGFRLIGLGEDHRIGESFPPLQTSPKPSKLTPILRSHLRRRIPSTPPLRMERHLNLPLCFPLLSLPILSPIHHQNLPPRPQSHHQWHGHW